MQSCIPSQIQQGPGDSLCKVVYHPIYSRDQEIHYAKLYTIPDTAGTRRFIMQSCIPSQIQQGPGDSLCKVV